MNTRFIYTIFLISVTYNIYSQDIIKQERYAISLLPGYNYFGSIDEIYSPYRYTGGNFSCALSFEDLSLQSSTKLSFFYGYSNRYPGSISLKSNIYVISYDKNYKYTWQATSSFLNKETHYFNEYFSDYYQIANLPLSTTLNLGFFQNSSLTYCKNNTTLELFSVSLGPCIALKNRLFEKVQLDLSIKSTIISLDIRNSYASVVGFVDDNNKMSNLFEDFKKYTYINNAFQHLDVSSEIMLRYNLNNHLAIISSYYFEYNHLSRPRPLKSAIYNINMGIRYAIY
jgi:hypothetical protein